MSNINTNNSTNNANRNNIISNIPVFNKEQLEYLNRVFPENTDVLDNSDMYYRAGQRQVLSHIEYLIEQARKRTQEM